MCVCVCAGTEIINSLVPGGSCTGGWINTCRPITIYALISTVKTWINKFNFALLSSIFYCCSRGTKIFALVPSQIVDNRGIPHLLFWQRTVLGPNSLLL